MLSENTVFIQLFNCSFTKPGSLKVPFRRYRKEASSRVRRLGRNSKVSLELRKHGVLFKVTDTRGRNWVGRRFNCAVILCKVRTSVRGFCCDRTHGSDQGPRREVDGWTCTNWQLPFNQTLWYHLCMRKGKDHIISKRYMGSQNKPLPGQALAGTSHLCVSIQGHGALNTQPQERSWSEREHNDGPKTEAVWLALLHPPS